MCHVSFSYNFNISVSWLHVKSTLSFHISLSVLVPLWSMTSISSPRCFASKATCNNFAGFMSCCLFALVFSLGFLLSVCFNLNHPCFVFEVLGQCFWPFVFAYLFVA